MMGAKADINEPAAVWRRSRNGHIKGFVAWVDITSAARGRMREKHRKWLEERKIGGKKE